MRSRSHTAILAATGLWLGTSCSAQDTPNAVGGLAMGLQSLAASVQLVTNSTPVLKRNCAFIGWIPDDGNPRYGSEGQVQTLQQLNQNTGIPSFSVGGYAHIYSNLYNRNNPATWFNGSELTPYLQQAVAGNATFMASISPIYGFQGFLQNDTTQAQQVVKVLQPFVNAGVPVWLRWAHEFDWYFTPGSDDEHPYDKSATYYVGTPAQYIEAWRTLYTIVKTALPSVRFFWCANVNSNDNIRPYWPGAAYVDIVGMDYYTSLYAQYSEYTNIVGVVKSFHDEFAVRNNLPFWLGETGTRTNDTSLNIQWMRTVTSADTCRQLSNYMGLWYFHYLKNYIDHYLVVPPTAPVTTQFKQLMATSG